MNYTFDGKRVCVARLVDAELVWVRSVTALALVKSEGAFSEMICKVRNDFRVKEFSDAPGLSTKASSEKAQVWFGV